VHFQYKWHFNIALLYHAKYATHWQSINWAPKKKCTPSVYPCVPVCVMHVCVCEREREREMAACVHPLRQETLHAWTQCE